MLCSIHGYVGPGKSGIPFKAGSKGDIVVSSGGSAWEIAEGAIVNADVNDSAAIAQSKLSLSITNTEVASGAAIAESKLNLASDAAAGTASRRTIGTGSLQACAGDDARLSDARTPITHTHNHSVVFPIASASTLYSPADGANMFFGSGNLATVTTTWETCRPFVLPSTMTLTHAYVYWNGTTAAGSGENISAYVRYGDATDILIATVGSTDAAKVFSNAALNGGVLTTGTQFAVKIVCPTWATNPTGVYVLGAIQFTDVTT